MEFSKLSYKDLQKELKKRGMKASGKKAVLLKRLRDVVANETSSTSTEKKVEQNPPPPSPKPKPKKKSEDVVRKR